MNTDLLKTLDPATTAEDLDVANDPTAQAVLQRLLASPPAPAPRPRRTRRLVLAAGVAGAVAALMAILAPSFLGGPQPATAAWSPIARPLDGTAFAEAEAACRTIWTDTMEVPLAPGVTTYVAEARGRWTFVYASDPSGAHQYTCRLLDGRFAGGGASSTDEARPPVPADGVLGAPQSASSNSQGSYWDSTGVVGADVVSLVLQTVEQGAVTATIADGHFAAWWPGPPTGGPGDAGRPEGVISATLTLRDGSTRTLTAQQLIGDVPVP